METEREKGGRLLDVLTSPRGIVVANIIYIVLIYCGRDDGLLGSLFMAAWLLYIVGCIRRAETRLMRMIFSAMAAAIALIWIAVLLP